MPKQVLGRDVLGKAHLKRTEVDVPEWNGIVLLRELTGAEVTAVRELASAAVGNDRKVKDHDALTRFGASLLIMGWIDKDGEPVLSKDDLPALLESSNAVVQRLGERVAELSGLNDAAAESAEKN